MRRSSLLFLALGLFLVVTSIMGLRRLSFDTDVLKILPTGIPEVESMQIIREYFDDDNRVILLLRHDEEVFEEDAAELKAHLRENLPGARVEYRSRFEDDLERSARSLAGMWADADPSSVAEFAAQLLDPAELEGLLQERKEEIRLSLDQSEATMSAYDPLGFLKHPAITQLRGNRFNHQSEDGTLWLIMIAKADLGVEYRTHAEWVDTIREAADRWEGEGFDYRLTGGPVFSAEVGAGMEKDMAGTISITCLIVGCLFLLIQRSFSQLGVLAVILGLTFLLTLGLAGWVFGTLNLVSVGFAAILLGLVIDYGVVIAREAIPGQSARVIRREMAPGILWAALTTAVVFGVLTLSTFKGVQQLGALVLMGLSVGAVVCLWIMPLALQRFPGKPPALLLRPPFPAPRAAGTVLAFLVIGAISLFSIKGWPRVDFDVAMVEPEVSEAAATLETLQELFPSWSKRNLSVVVQGENLAEVRQLGKETERGIEELREAGVISWAQWPTALLPDPGAREANRELWRRVSEKAEQIDEMMEEAGFSEKGRKLSSLVLQNLQDPGDAQDPSTRLFYHPDGYFVGRIQLQDAVNEVNVGQVRSLNRESVTVSGWGVLRLILLERVRADLYFLFLPATAVLLGALIVVFRSWRDALLTTGVLLTVLLLVNALAVATGRPWNFLSSMAIPLIVGTGIDYSIHLIFALRRNKGDLAKVWNGVGKGIVFCGLSTVVGFGSLIFASNETLQSMGLFCSTGVFLTMVLSVLVVPALWRAGKTNEKGVVGS